MGGNARHMPHVWEHYDATFGEVLNLLESLTSGTIGVTEKFDGCNIHFRVDNGGVVRFSRNASNIRDGGFTFAEALTLYQNHDARDTFINGCRAIDEAYTGQWWPFGYSGRDWINAEIIYKQREQLLKYTESAIVLHRVVTFSPSGKNKLFDTKKQDKLTSFALNDKADPGKLAEWKILGPCSVSLTDDSGFGYFTDAKNRILKCMSVAGLTKESTLREFLRYSLLAGPLSKIRTSTNVRENLADKISGTNSKIRLVDLKKNQPSGVVEKIRFYGLAENEHIHHRAAMKPIINTIDAFAAARLRQLTSVLISDALVEKDRLMIEITKDAEKIESASDEHAATRMEMFNSFLAEWNAIESEPAVIEGVTFDFCGKRTKITGGFATLNQLLGVCRYGRGGIPPINDSVERKEKNSALTLAEWFDIL